MTEDARKKIKEHRFISSAHKILRGGFLVLIGITLVMYFYFKADETFLIASGMCLLMYIFVTWIARQYEAHTKFKLDEERWKEEVSKIEKVES